MKTKLFASTLRAAAVLGVGLMLACGDSKTSGGGTETVATPTFSPAEGSFNTAQNATIATAPAGATIHYELTSDGATPTSGFG